MFDDVSRNFLLNPLEWPQDSAIQTGTFYAYDGSGVIQFNAISDDDRHARRLQQARPSTLGADARPAAIHRTAKEIEPSYSRTQNIDQNRGVAVCVHCQIRSFLSNKQQSAPFGGHLDLDVTVAISALYNGSFLPFTLIRLHL